MAFADDFKAGLQRAIRIIKLETAAMTEVANDEGALVTGVVIVAIAGLLSGLSAFPIGIVTLPLVTLVGSFIGVGLIFLTGTLLFKVPNWDFLRLYRPLSHAYLLGWVGVLGIIPVLGQLIAALAGLYQLVVWILTVETVGKVDRGKAVAIVLIPVAVCCVLAGAVFVIGGAAVLGMLGMKGLGSMH